MCISLMAGLNCWNLLDAGVAGVRLSACRDVTWCVVTCLPVDIEKAGKIGR